MVKVGMKYTKRKEMRILTKKRKANISIGILLLFVVIPTLIIVSVVADYLALELTDLIIKESLK